MLSECLAQRWKSITGRLEKQLLPTENQFNTEIINLLMRPIDCEYKKLETKNITISKEKCVEKFEITFLEFERTLLDDKLAKRNGSDIYGDALDVLESKLQDQQLNFIDKSICDDAEQDFNSIVVIVIFLKLKLHLKIKTLMVL